METKTADTNNAIDGTRKAAEPLATRPLVWLYIAAAGIAITGIGVAIDSYRYDHGAAAAGLISR